MSTKEIKSKKIYDVCLISDAATNFDKTYKIKGIESGFALLVKFVIKFCKDHKKKIIFAIKREEKKGYKIEIKFFKDNLNREEFKFLIRNSIPRNVEKYTSYSAMVKSIVSIGCMTTMLRENLSMGGKIFACNFTSVSLFDFPLNKFFSFKKKIIMILK